MTPGRSPYAQLAIDHLATLERAEFRRRFESVFRVAYEFVGEKALAIDVAAAVLLDLPTVSVRQEARFAFRPKGTRKKPWIPDSGIVHRLVYARVDPVERKQEQCRTLDFDAWARRIIKQLNWVALRGGNSLWATVSRSIIFHLTAGQTADIHAAIAQNHVSRLCRVKEEDAIRRHRRIFLRALKDRFGDRLRLMKAGHGENRFLDYQNLHLHYPPSWPERPPLTVDHVQDITYWMSKLQPWSEQSRIGLCYLGDDTDIEQFHELERMRMVFDPDAYPRLLSACALPAPRHCLTFPLPMHGAGGPETRERLSAPVLSDDELDIIRENLNMESELRKASAEGRLVVVANGRDYYVLHNRSGQLKIKLPEGTESIQVVERSRDRQFVLATHLLTYGDLARQERLTFQTRAHSGQSDCRFTFCQTTSYNERRDRLDVCLELRYELKDTRESTSAVGPFDRHRDAAPSRPTFFTMPIRRSGAIRPKRTLFWVSVAAAVLLIIALSISRGTPHANRGPSLVVKDESPLIPPPVPQNSSDDKPPAPVSRHERAPLPDGGMSGDSRRPLVGKNESPDLPKEEQPMEPRPTEKGPPSNGDDEEFIADARQRDVPDIPTLGQSGLVAAAALLLASGLALMKRRSHQ